MLVLSRKRHEEIVVAVGDVEVVLSVTKIRGDKVYLGVDAPRDCPVHRREVWEEIKRQANEPDDTV